MKYVFYIAAALSALSCGPSQEPATPREKPVTTSTAAPTSGAPSTQPVTSAAPSSSSSEPASPEAPPADIAALAKDNNAFALALYTKVSGDKGNLFLSPASISTALAMTYAGARGKTADEMAKTLRFTLEPGRLHRAFGSFVRDLNAGGKKGGYQLSIANRLWGQKGYGFLQPFLSLTNDHYGAGLDELDFARDAEASRATINQWTQEKTEGKIKDLLKPGLIKPDTRLVLTNAIHFKGSWVSQFKKESTADEPFLVDGKTKVNVPMMRQSGAFKHAERDGVQALEMPYSGGALSMVILLPTQATGLAELEKKLSPETLSAWIGALSPARIEVSVPKFKLERDIELSSTLQAMGMSSAFSAKADFSGMSGKTDLFLSAVVHKAFVDVNEEGTEAAAATAVIATRKNGGPPKPLVFKADHPFVFMIRDTATGAVLFLGRVTSPKA